MPYENFIEIPAGTIIPNGVNIGTTTTIPPILPVNTAPVPILEPIGLAWPNPNLSNGLSSRLIAGAAGINDFSIVNPYIHYASPPGGIIQFDPTALLELATIRFNIYGSQYRR